MNSLKILLLEDDPLDVEMIRRTLSKSESFKVELENTDNPEEFLKYLKDFQPDLIIADYCLPKYSGIEALKMVIEYDDKIPLIFASGVIGEELAAEAVLMGASGFVLKSNINKMNDIIVNVLNAGKKATKSKQLDFMTSAVSTIKSQIKANYSMLDEVENMLRKE